MNSSTHYHEWRENSNSLAQDGGAKERYATLESQVREIQSMAKLKQFKAQVIDLRFTFNLE